jgi:curli biogenesis system outer membrane secretion channel CsgG
MKRILFVIPLCALFLLAAAMGQAQLKKRIAVSRFEDRSGARYAGIGKGVADMLATALVKSGKFSVIERQDLDKVFAEQHLGQSGAVTPESAAKAGKVLGVELLVIGSVSEFGIKKREVSGAFKVFGAGVDNKEARAVVDLRLVNSTTAEIIAAESEEGTENTLGVGIRYESLNFNDVSSWNDTDIGKACREAVDKCVALIVENMGKVPWSGKVLKVNADGSVVMKPGSEAGVAVGTEFLVYRPGDEIKDPDTGLSLGNEETKIGRVKVTEDMLKGKACKAIVLEGAPLQVGDIIREKPE